MAKKSVSSNDVQDQPEDRMGYLSDVLTDLHSAQEHMRDCLEASVHIDGTYLRLLIGATMEKIYYYEDKYSLKIRSDDIFYTEELIDFIRAKDKMMAKRERQEV